MADFFISYTQADRPWAEWIAWVLEEAKYSVVIQAWDFRPGSNFVLAMDDALRQAERVVAVLSPDYVQSDFARSEWAGAFAGDPAGRGQKLVPVRVREVDLAGLLGPTVYIDFVGVHDEAATRKLLLEGVERGRAKPDTKPAFPPRTIKKQPRFPGSLPSIWNVPHNRNRNFTGRVELLAMLRSQLQAGHHSALTALHGLGGIGKTQTAVEYAYRYASEYELVWWLRAEDPTTLASEYALLAARLGLPEAEADQQAAIQAVRHWLTGNGGWLLVLDNANSPEEVRPYLPAGSGGHVIITSRRPDWRSIAEPLSVSTLSPEDAIDFLHRRSGQQDEAASRELVEDLGRLPLAIEQAAAYIEQHAKSIAEYLALFRKHQQAILKRGRPSNYPASVETTWQLSFAKVREQSPAGADLLNLCAFLAPDDIPLHIIRDGGDRLPETLAGAAGDELEFDDAVSALRQYSLVELTEDALSVHRLVQAVVRDRMETSDRQRWARLAAAVMGKAFPYDSDDVRTWVVCARLFAHATAVATHCEAENSGSEFAALLLSQTALYMHARADLQSARSLNERALIIFEAIHGPDHPRVAISVNNLGHVLKDLGDFAAARNHYQRAIRIFETTHGTNHPYVAASVNNLGRLLQTLGDLASARTHYERTLKIDEAAYGPDHPEVAVALNNLGNALKALGEFGEARELFERSLRIFEASRGLDHPQVSDSLNNLGSVLHDLGRSGDALGLFERALEIDRAAYGPNHPNVARDVNNLAGVLKSIGDLGGARKHYAQAVSIFEAVYGHNHPQVAISVNNLGSVLQELGELDDARRHYERALKICEASYGPDHPHTQLVRRNLRMLDAPEK